MPLEVGTAYLTVKPQIDNTWRRNIDADVDHVTRGIRSKFTGAFKSVALAAGGAFAGVAAYNAFKGAIRGASDLAESASKVRVVFGPAAKEVQDFAKTTARSMGISKSEALAAAGTFGNLFTALKIGQGDSARMSTTLVKLAGDLASFNNVSPEEALQALRSGLVGETEPLKRFGVNMNEATLQTKALELGLIRSEKEALTPAAKAQAAYALIMEQTKAAQGDYSRTSDGLANRLRTIGAVFKDIRDANREEGLGVEVSEEGQDVGRHLVAFLPVGEVLVPDGHIHVRRRPEQVDEGGRFREQGRARGWPGRVVVALKPFDGPQELGLDSVRLLLKCGEPFVPTPWLAFGRGRMIVHADLAFWPCFGSSAPGRW